MFDLPSMFKGMGQQGGAGGWAAGTTVKPEGSLFTQGLDGSIAGLNNKTLGAAFQTAGDVYSKQQAGQPMHPIGAFAHGMEQQAQAGQKSDPRETIRRLVQQAYMQNQQG